MGLMKMSRVRFSSTLATIENMFQARISLVQTLSRHGLKIPDVRPTVDLNAVQIERLGEGKWVSHFPDKFGGKSVFDMPQEGAALLERIWRHGLLEKVPTELNLNDS